MSFRSVLLLVLVGQISAGCGQTPPPAGSPDSKSISEPPGVDPEGALERNRRLVAAADARLEALELALIVDGIADDAQRTEIATKIQTLRDDAATSHSFLSGGGSYHGRDTCFVVTPVSDVGAAIKRIDFGKVLAIDLERRTVLVDAAEGAAVLGPDGVPGPEGIDQFILERTIRTAVSRANNDLIEKHGRENVVIIWVPQEPVPADGVRASPDSGELTTRVRQYANESLPSIQNFGPWNSLFVTITAAPASNYREVLNLLEGAPLMAADEEKRVILIGDLEQLRPRSKTKELAPGPETE